VKAYRTYIVDADGRVQLGRAFEAPDDKTAGALAELAAIRGALAELWEGGRLVGEVSSQGVFNMGDNMGDRQVGA
jgi:hypothetical protein